MRQATPLLLIIAIACPAQGAENAPLAFGAPKKSKARGFDGKPAPRRPGFDAGKRDRDYARKLFDTYDTNGDRVLQKDEWSKISGSPEKSDANGDGEITFDELVARVTLRNREKAALAIAERAKQQATDKRSSRLTPPHDALPEGLPSWFKQRDANRDGQVAMHEYSRSWSGSTVRRFERIDTNGDGLLTPREAIENR